MHYLVELFQFRKESDVIVYVALHQLVIVLKVIEVMIGLLPSLCCSDSLHMYYIVTVTLLTCIIIIIHF